MKTLTVISMLTLINVICYSQIIHVPADYNTIQLGINAANNGDTVLVDQGIYYENINFMGQAITVASHYILDADSAHIINTIIDGSQPTNPDIGSVVTFDSNTDTTSCLLGFTITGGTGTKPSFTPFPLNTGGGVVFTSAGGKLTSNIIDNNACILDTPDGFVLGGGIGGGPPLEDHLIIIRNNIIRNNIAWTKGSSSAWNMGWAEGGGIYLCYNAVVEGNQIVSNICRSDNRISGGGAIRMIADPEFATYQILVEVRNNLIKNNKSKSESFGAFAGGISCSAANTVIENNEITGNSVESQNYCRGAGLYLDLINTYYAKVNNNFIDSNFSISSISDGGAIGLYQSIDIEICNNLIENNSADYGGAFSINASLPRLISNNTVLNNLASEEGGSFYIYNNSETGIFNSILRDNIPDEIDIENGSTLSIQYSNIMGDWSGEGNIDEDPLFIGSGNHPFSLSAGSPCIDEGLPDTTGLNLPNYDIIGNLRILDGDNNGTEIIDMGAYEFTPLTGYDEFIVPNSELEIRTYPNPVNNKATIEFELVREVLVHLTISNINGQEIAILNSEILSAGKHKFEWNTKELQSGIYFYTLQINEEFQSIKIVKD